MIEDSRRDSCPRKNRRHAQKRLPAFVVIWQVRPCVVPRSSSSKRCKRHITSYWQRPRRSLTPPFTQLHERGNGLRRMSWRMFVPLQRWKNGRSAALLSVVSSRPLWMMRLNRLRPLPHESNYWRISTYCVNAWWLPSLRAPPRLTSTLSGDTRSSATLTGASGCFSRVSIRSITLAKYKPSQRHWHHRNHHRGDRADEAGNTLWGLYLYLL